MGQISLNMELSSLILRELIHIHKLLKTKLIGNKQIQQNCMHCAPLRVLDNADIKNMLKIGDTKLYYLKKKKILKVYKLDGKDVYLEHEVIEAIRRANED